MTKQNKYFKLCKEYVNVVYSHGKLSKEAAQIRNKARELQPSEELQEKALNKIGIAIV